MDMKKIFTLLTSALFAATVGATDYNGPLSVTLNGSTMPSGETTVSYTEGADGTCDLSLKNFSFAGMPIGTINLKGVAMDKKPLTSVFGDKKTLIIDKGDDAAVETWYGPGMGPMQVFVKGSVQNGKLNAVILIDMTANEFGIIKVHFGNRADEVGQIANSGFERFREEKIGLAKGYEPDGWHSFLSCDGSLATLAGGSHTEESKDVRPGTTSTKSVKVFSSAVWGKSANGTISTGRISAGSTTESDPSNHSYIDMSKTDKDSAGDPFYTALVARPDAVSAWVKYVPGKAGITATMSAVITDGSYYQDPEDPAVTYKNVCSKASNTAIGTNNGEWQQITLPLDYAKMDDNATLKARAILLTMSTCSVPGGGSTDKKNPDCLYIDDVELVYNYLPSAITYDGQALPSFDASNYSYSISGAGDFDASKLASVVNGKDCETSVSVVDEGDGAVTAFYSFISGDYQKTATYEISYTKQGGDSSSINGVEAGVKKGAAGVYDLSGRRVKLGSQHGVYIVRTADGKTVKISK